MDQQFSPTVPISLETLFSNETNEGSRDFPLEISRRVHGQQFLYLHK